MNKTIVTQLDKCDCKLDGCGFNPHSGKLTVIFPCSGRPITTVSCAIRLFTPGSLVQPNRKAWT